jgi:hypothetical protein
VTDKKLRFEKVRTPSDDQVTIEGDGAKILINFLDGSSVTVTLVRTTHMNIQVSLSGCFFNKVSGLCGNFNSKNEDDRPPHEQFLVQSTENYFTRGVNAVRASATTLVVPKTTTCKLPASANRRDLAEAGKISKAMATARCETLLQQQKCAETISWSSFRDTCVRDIMATGDLRDGEDARVAFVELCADTAKSLGAVNDTSPNSTKVLKRVIKLVFKYRDVAQENITRRVEEGTEVLNTLMKMIVRHVEDGDPWTRGS